MQDQPLVRKVDATEEERSHCGFRQRLLKKADDVPASITYLAVEEADEHYHNETAEFYYVLEGSGHLHLDDRIVELEPHMTVYIPPGVKHYAEGDVRVLVICVPPFDADDQHLD